MSSVGVNSKGIIMVSSSIAFKISRKSALASTLKSSISDQLRHFLVNYTDNVLAEYITVLVCNRKDQYQIREDLKAFLGDRSGEFVSWLWDHLLKYVQCNNSKDITIINPCGSGGGKDSMSERLKNFDNDGSGNKDGLLSKDDKLHLPAAAPNLASYYTEIEIPGGFSQFPGFTYPVSGINSKEVLSTFCKEKACRRCRPSGNVVDDSLTIGKESSSVIASGLVAKPFQRVDKFKKISHSSNLLPNQVVYLPKRESDISIWKSSTSGEVLLQRSTYQNQRCHGSVWDRLDKPCDTPLQGKVIDLQSVGSMNKRKAELNEQTTRIPALNSELSGNITVDVSRLGNICLDSNLPESRKMKSTVSTLHEPNLVNKRRKRHFGEIVFDPGALVSQSKDIQCKSISWNFETSRLMAEESKHTSNLLLELLDVKKKLRKVEIEMCKLRAKQLEMEKDGKFNELLRSGGTIHAEEDSESRTVLVTNVHFSATKEALKSYFAKCGVVDNVLILAEKFTAPAQPKGSAYITFASKDSIAKAVALSGTIFCSRILKVYKMGKASAGASGLAQCTVKSYQPLSSQFNRTAIFNKPYFSRSHLQWRREPAPSESSSLVNFQEK